MVISVFLSLALIVFLGSMVTKIFPEIDVTRFRQNINKLVLYIFLPALNFKVIYNSEIGGEFWKLPLTAFLGIAFGIILAILSYHFMRLDARSKGVLILACAFGNVTYFGIAVLQGLFPEHVNEVIKVAVLFEITLVPLNILLGSLLASFYGKKGTYSVKDSLLAIAKLPILWVTIIAIVLNLAKEPVPHFITSAVNLLAVAVSGLMILSLGLALKYPVFFSSFRRIHILLPVLLIKLILAPFFIFFVSKWLDIQSPYAEASIIESAMPTQLLTLIVADRFDLDSELLAVVISLDTVLSFFTIPIIHSLL